MQGFIYGREKNLNYVSTWSHTPEGLEAYDNFQEEMRERGFRPVVEGCSLVKYYQPRTTRASLWTYRGRHGKGYAVTFPCWFSSNYSYIQYYTLPGGNDDE